MIQPVLSDSEARLVVEALQIAKTSYEGVGVTEHSAHLDHIAAKIATLLPNDGPTCGTRTVFPDKQNTHKPERF